MTWLIGFGFIALGIWIRTKVLVIDKRGIRIIKKDGETK